MQLSIGLTLGAQQRGRPSTITINTAPAISGTPTVGSTLTRTTGSYSGSGTVTVSNGRWTRNGVDIPGATGATYDLVVADAGASVRWVELATDDETSRTVASAPVTVLASELTATGNESASETGGSVIWITGLTAVGNESASETGTATVQAPNQLTATGNESASETGEASVSDPAPVMTGVEFDGDDTISINLSEPATIYWMVDDNATRTPAQVEAGGGEASGSFAVTTGANTDSVDLSGVTAGDYYLHIVAKDASGQYSTVDSTEYTFAGPQIITATGNESASETGEATVWITSLVATGNESASESGAAAFVSGVWVYTGSVVTNLPTDEGWEFTGSVVDTIPAAA